MPRKIALTKGYVALVDDEDYEQLNQHKWYAADHGQRVYAARKSQRPQRHEILMHCEILKVRGVDHVNHDLKHLKIVDNRKANLRPATYAENAMNRRKRGGTSSKYKGVSRCTQTQLWKVSVMLDGRHRWVGRFRNEIEAAAAYDQKAKELFGEYALTNATLYPADFKEVCYSS